MSEKEELAAALAVIEQVGWLWDREINKGFQFLYRPEVVPEMRRLLDQDPATVLDDIKADAWEQGIEAGYDHSANQHTPSGIPIDPPANPYRNEATS